MTHLINSILLWFNRLRWYILLILNWISWYSRLVGLVWIMWLSKHEHVNRIPQNKISIENSTHILCTYTQKYIYTHKYSQPPSLYKEPPPPDHYPSELFSYWYYCSFSFQIRLRLQFHQRDIDQHAEWFLVWEFCGYCCCGRCWDALRSACDLEET